MTESLLKRDEESLEVWFFSPADPSLLALQMPHTFIASAVRFCLVPQQTLGALVANCISIAKSVCKQTVIENVRESQLV